MGARQAVELFYADEIKNAANPEEFREQKTKEYTELYADTMAFASQVTYIHDFIEPRDTRRTLVRSLRLTGGKDIKPYPKRHGNIPL
jgi:acetyl-CoA carboxylase carboxyltransferase component